jgi:hypothetical protein
MSSAPKPSPKDPALSRLIGDITVRKMTKAQILEHYKQGRYAGASDAHVSGYVKEHFK